MRERESGGSGEVVMEYGGSRGRLRWGGGGMMRGDGEKAWETET